MGPAPGSALDVADFAYEALMLMVQATGQRKGHPPAPDPTFQLVLENSEIDPADFSPA